MREWGKTNVFHTESTTDVVILECGGTRRRTCGAMARQEWYTARCRFCNSEKSGAALVRLMPDTACHRTPESIRTFAHYRIRAFHLLPPKEAGGLLDLFSIIPELGDDGAAAADV